MIKHTLDGDTGQLDDLLASLLRSVSELRHEVDDLKTQVEAGEDTGIKETKARIAALRGMVEQCQKVETLLHESTNKRGKGGCAYLDLDAARAEIGCRLDRLAACCGA